MFTEGIYYYDPRSISSVGAAAYARNNSNLKCISCIECKNPDNNIKAIRNITYLIDPDTDFQNIVVYIFDLEYSETIANLINEATALKMTVVWIDNHPLSVELAESNASFLNNKRLHYLIKDNMSTVKLTYLYLLIQKNLQADPDKAQYRFNSLQTENDIIELYDNNINAYVTCKFPHVFNRIDSYDRMIDEFTDNKYFIRALLDMDNNPEAAEQFWTDIIDESSPEAVKNMYSQVDEMIMTGKESSAALGIINSYCLSHKAFAVTFEGYNCLMVKLRINRYPELFDEFMDEYDILIAYHKTNSGAFNYWVYSSSVDLHDICKKYNGSAKKSGKYGTFKTDHSLLLYSDVIIQKRVQAEYEEYLA